MGDYGRFILKDVDTHRRDLKALKGAEFNVYLRGVGAHATFASAEKGTWHTSSVTRIERGAWAVIVVTRNTTYYFEDAL